LDQAFASAWTLRLVGRTAVTGSRDKLIKVWNLKHDAFSLGHILSF